ncbi:hypothetical protein [Agrobacterium tumefaciens]|uniref:hypothetical protein n=1 Tax=Agrobacterium tumefaciens TaxID=358 RepID=UPI00157598DE|nr:hypothetical protein [Agrobacterium tumefaciens]NTZ92062.1 hypothetical protein [Agrobacterium tumefaciens]
MQTSIQYPEPEDFIAALAKPFDSEAVTKIVAPFGVSWSDAIKLDRDLAIFDLSAVTFGVDFHFKDRALVNESDGHSVGEGPNLLTSCACWGYEKGVETYGGSLWKDLRFSDTKVDAIAKLGEPDRVGRYDIHQWILPDFKLSIHWNSPDKIRVVSYWMISE